MARPALHHLTPAGPFADAGKTNGKLDGVSILSGQGTVDMQQSSPAYYAESSIAVIIVIARPASQDEVGEMVDAEERPAASSFSSLRMHPVLSVSTDGHGTRRKFAL
jgi:hypothetical protein